MPSVTTIRQRLEYLMDSASGIESQISRYNDDPTTPLEEVDLPAYFVDRAGRAEHQNAAAQELFTSRRWLIWVVVQEIADNTIDSKQEADEAAEDLLDDLMYYLSQHSHLDVDENGNIDNGLSGLQGINWLGDGVKKEYQRATKRYSALAIIAEVGSNRSS